MIQITKIENGLWLGNGLDCMKMYEMCNTLMMTSSNGNIFRVTGPLWGEFTGHRWIPLAKDSDAELWCILWSAPEHTVLPNLKGKLPGFTTKRGPVNCPRTTPLAEIKEFTFVLQNWHESFGCWLLFSSFSWLIKHCSMINMSLSETRSFVTDKMLWRLIYHNFSQYGTMAQGHVYNIIYRNVI